MAETMILSAEARHSFYPTPPDIADRMLEGIRLGGMERILEPSAGTGNLVAAVARKMREDIPGFSQRWHRTDSVDVDCVEIDPALRDAILREWGGSKLDELKRFRYQFEHGEQPDTTDAEREKYLEVKKEIDLHEAVKVRIVHDDFITYKTFTPYGLILMNPPFHHGDIHLLRAISMQERTGGLIRCLLNAETLRNPYTQRRKALARRLDELCAEIEYIPGAFRGADRKTDVEIALVKIEIPAPEGEESEFYSRMKKAADAQIEADQELKELITADYLQAAVQSYEVETAATMKFYREYRNLLPYMRRDLTDKGCDSPLITLQVFRPNEYGYTEFDLQRYIRAVRLKYWKALLYNPKFTAKLTSKLAEKYRSMLNSMADYEFSVFNIQQLYLEINREVAVGIEAEILALFETLTTKYANWPECKTTIHYFNGWRTNKAHMIGEKVILPENAYDYNTWDKSYEFNTLKAGEVLEDIEKALDYLAAVPHEESWTMGARLDYAKANGQFRNVEFKYFSADFYKKRTMHIKFNKNALPIIQRLNIFGSQRRGWLPPDYGKKQYADMDAEQRAVLDSFHGDGTEGSGAENYGAVLRNAAYYLAEPARNLPALTEGNREVEE